MFQLSSFHIGTSLCVKFGIFSFKFSSSHMMVWYSSSFSCILFLSILAHS